MRKQLSSGIRAAILENTFARHHFYTFRVMVGGNSEELIKAKLSAVEK